MPVTTVPAASVSYNPATGSHVFVTPPPSVHASRSRAVQQTPRFDLIVPGMFVAIDCEGVILDDEVGRAKCGCGRVSIVNEREEVIFDTFVHYGPNVRHRPPPQRFHFGVKYADIRPGNGAMHIDNVTTIVTTILDKAEVIVAHAIENEMGYLRYVPWKKYAKKCVDTQQFSTVQRGGGLKLAYLASVYLGRDIQGEEHSSVEDAQATMALYFFLKQKEAKQAEGTTTSVQDSGYSESSTAAASSKAAHLEDSSVPLVPMTEPVTTAPTCLADSNESPSALSGLASIDIEALRAAASRKIAVPYIKALAKGRRFDWRTSTYY